jgi:anti-sigma factor RsiW
LDCSRYRTQIVPLIKGNLGPEDSQHLRRHLEGCGRCRREFEEADWLVAGMNDIREETRDGHVSSTLLYHFVRSAQSLEPETIDFIRTHLDRCGQCRQDAAVVEQLLRIPVENGEFAPQAAPTRLGFWRAIYNRRLVAGFAAAVAVALLLVVWVSSWDAAHLPAIAKVVSQPQAEHSGYTVVALANDMTTRGGGAPGTTAAAVIAEDDRALVLTLEAVTFKDEELSFSALIKASDGGLIWQSDVAADQLDSGRLWLIMNRKHFDPGIYQISVVEHQGDYRATVSTARFEIVE